MTAGVEEQFLSLVLDGLDDLYDQRFGAPVGGIRDTRAEIWLDRLLFAAAQARRGSTWETQLLDVASDIQAPFRSGSSGDELDDAALEATAELRLAIASVL